jgi:hypothetical protein
MSYFSTMETNTFINTDDTDDDWVIVQYTSLSEPFWGIVVNK